MLIGRNKHAPAAAVKSAHSSARPASPAAAGGALGFDGTMSTLPPLSESSTDPDGPGEGNLVLSYLALRRAVGYFGLVLPVAVFAVGIALPPHRFLGSISAYYYVPFAGDVFVGILWVIGIFLWFYDYRDPDKWLTSASGTFAIGIALFPTTKEDLPRTLISVATVHVVCAVSFFATLAALSLFYFTRGDASGRPRKQTRNRVYRVAALVIVAALVVAGLGPVVLGREASSRLHLLFFCETAACWAFGASWLVKGKRLWADPPTSNNGH